MGETLLDQLLERYLVAPPEEQAKLAEEAVAGTKDRMWVPNPGPQTEAFYCVADELLYGGEPGGGKSDLVIGLSVTEHQRSLVLRRTNAEAVKLFDRYEAIIGHSVGKNEQRGWKLPGRSIDIGGCQLEKDKQKRKGVPHDLKAFDELTDFTKTQYLFIITWNRSTDPNQRCRVVATTNAPTNTAGVWVIERWAAWLDPTHPNPAKSGELRWYLQLPDDTEIEVDGPGPHKVPGEAEPVRARSRTFIRSHLEDNPDLAKDGRYQAQLASAGGEMRALARGDFQAALEDKPYQAIPTAWIRAAQERWTPMPPEGIPMCAIGVDCTGGGADPMVLAIRHDGWYDKLVVIPGKDVPADRAGKAAAGIVVSYRRDKAGVIVDMGGGYGTALYEKLNENDIDAAMFKGANASVRRTEDHQYGFSNMRTEAYWKFREALDPTQPGGSPIMLPPDLEILAELAAPTFEEKNKIIALLSKEKVMELLGRSPNKADAIVMAWAYGARYVTHGKIWGAEHKRRDGGARGKQYPVVMGRTRRQT